MGEETWVDLSRPLDHLVLIPPARSRSLWTRRYSEVFIYVPHDLGIPILKVVGYNVIGNHEALNLFFFIMLGTKNRVDKALVHMVAIGK
jgi:hypothetical protein